MDLTWAFPLRDGCVDVVRSVGHATGNEIPQAPHTSFTGLPFRRLAGVLAGRLGPIPVVLSGAGSQAPTGASVSSQRGVLRAGRRAGVPDPLLKHRTVAGKVRGR